MIIFFGVIAPILLVIGFGYLIIWLARKFNGTQT